MQRIPLRDPSLNPPSLPSTPSRKFRIRLPAPLPVGWLLTTTGGMGGAFGVGLWVGGLFSAPTAAEFQGLLAAGSAPRPVIWVAPPIEGVRAAVVPVSTGLKAEVVAAAKVVKTPLAPAIPAPALQPTATSPKPVTRVAAATDSRESQRKSVALQAVNRVPNQKAAPTLVAAPTPVTASAPVTPAVPDPQAPALPRYHGSLAIRSEPLGAVVTVDGQVVGATPLLLKGIRAGSRVVRIESQGYERWSFGARVVANQETAVIATLQRAPGQ